MEGFVQSLRLALKSIAGNKLRAALTMLGIIIGVMALVILVSLVNGATGTVTDTISELGSNLLTVTIKDDKGKPLYLDELDSWTEKPGIGLIAASSRDSLTAKYGSEYATATVYGTTASYYEIQGLSMLLGRYLKSTDVDNHNYICVINETVATELVGYTDCLGETLKINGVNFKIVGILEDKDSSLTAAFSKGTLAIYVPYTALIRVSESVSSNIGSFYVSAERGETTGRAELAMTDILMDRLDNDEDAFKISNTDALEEAMENITTILAVLLGGIAAISLIVGGIGIMNIMLVTVTERTREIGIRKAIGASRGVILQQFLLESVVLCMLGCVLGILLSWGVLKIVTAVVSGLDMSFDMNITVVLIAVAFCFFIGVAFGLYPANKAAKMKPIDALHYDG